jgi:hypothetical protein
MDAYNTDVRAINANLQVLKRSGASYDRILVRLNAAIDKLEKALFYHSTQKNDLVKEKESREQFMGNIKAILKSHTEKTKRANESVDSFSNMAKQTLSNTQFKKLADVKQDQAIDELFRFLYINLYNEPESSYDFGKFKNVALKKDLTDFQKRLAQFSVIRLDAQGRERLDEIKRANYTANEQNEDLYALLAWLEYNYEAFVALKEKEQAEKLTGDIKNKEKKYVGFNNNSQRLLTDLIDIVSYCEENLTHLKLYKKRLEEANELWMRNQNQPRLKENMAKIFAAVDGFKGNDVMEELDLTIGNAPNGQI